MAKKTSAADTADTVGTKDVPELLPQFGGSYIRNPDTGELTQTEGPDFIPDTPAANPTTTQE